MASVHFSVKRSSTHPGIRSSVLLESPFAASRPALSRVIFLGSTLLAIPPLSASPLPPLRPSVRSLLHASRSSSCHSSAFRCHSSALAALLSSSSSARLLVLLRSASGLVDPLPLEFSSAAGAAGAAVTPSGATPLGWPPPSPLGASAPAAGALAAAPPPVAPPLVIAPSSAGWVSCDPPVPLTGPLATPPSGPTTTSPLRAGLVLVVFPHLLQPGWFLARKRPHVSHVPLLSCLS